MQTLQMILNDTSEIPDALSGLAAIKPDLVLVFAAAMFFEKEDFAPALTSCFPDACIVGCSTAGEISSDGALQDRCVVTAVRFASTAVITRSTPIADMSDSYAAGRRLAEQIFGHDLQAVMVFGPGVDINGCALINGMTEILGCSLPITGGLAGDNDSFKRTWTIGPDGASDRAVVAVGLHGDRLSFSHGSFGGWKPFGPARKVTRCKHNILYELDGEPALQVYKNNIGEYARDLPASGLLFPFAMLNEARNSVELIRTMHYINEAEGSLVLAGEIQLNSYLKLMHATTDSLVDGADVAAQKVVQMYAPSDSRLAILVSCVGRKMVMGDRVDDEIEAVAAVLGDNTTLAGFYSYGEICPLAPGGSCKLHNQTMTITCLAES